MEQSPTKQLVNWLHDLSYEDIPFEVRGHVKLCILDTIGCGLIGQTTREGKILTDYAGTSFGSALAGIWGSAVKTSPQEAAMINASLVEAYTMDDLHHGSIMHGGAVTVPPALALAEYLGKIDGKRLLTAIVSGYEAAIRIGLSIAPNVRIRGFHPVGISGPFGAAAVSAKLLGLEKDSFLHALGIAGSQGAGLMSAQFNSMVQRLHAGKAAHSGVLSAFLAQKGFTGITNILEADYGGFCSTFSDEPALARTLQGLGERFEVQDVGFRLYSCAGSVCTTVDAILDVVRTYQIQPEQVEQVVVHCSKSKYLHCGWKYEPASVITAQMSISYGAAVVLLFGKASIEQYSDSNIADPTILEMIEKIQVVHDPKLDGLDSSYAYYVNVEVKLTDGRILHQSVQHARGSSGNPCSKQEIFEKFRNLSGYVMPQESIREMIDMVDHLEEVSDIAEFTKLLRIENE